MHLFMQIEFPLRLTLFNFLKFLYHKILLFTLTYVILIHKQKWSQWDFFFLNSSALRNHFILNFGNCCLFRFLCSYHNKSVFVRSLHFSCILSTDGRNLGVFGHYCLSLCRIVIKNMALNIIIVNFFKRSLGPKHKVIISPFQYAENNSALYPWGLVFTLEKLVKLSQNIISVVLCIRLSCDF